MPLERPLTREENEECTRRIFEEVERLKREIINCAHCKALRDQICNLYAIMPPQPQEIGGKHYEYVGPWLTPDDIKQRLRQLGMEQELG